MTKANRPAKAGKQDREGVKPNAAGAQQSRQGTAAKRISPKKKPLQVEVLPAPATSTGTKLVPIKKGAPPATIGGLIKQITAAYAAFADAARGTLERARDVGLALLEAKELVGHGKFQPWVKQNFEFSHETACGYMRIAQRWQELATEKRGATPTLSINSALKLLAKPRRERKPKYQTATTATSRANTTPDKGTTATSTQPETAEDDPEATTADTANDEATEDEGAANAESQADDTDTAASEAANATEKSGEIGDEADGQEPQAATTTYCEYLHQIVQDAGKYRDAYIDEIKQGLAESIAGELLQGLAKTYMMLRTIGKALAQQHDLRDPWQPRGG